MGLVTWSLLAQGAGHAFFCRHFVPVFAVLYALNMYFQSFGAVAIVKVNASWFHVRERGVFGGIFGILISLGVYFAYDWGGIILKHRGLIWVFFIPAASCSASSGCSIVFIVRDPPSEAGFADFDTGRRDRAARPARALGGRHVSSR